MLSSILGALAGANSNSNNSSNTNNNNNPMGGLAAILPLLLGGVGALRQNLNLQTLQSVLSRPEVQGIINQARNLPGNIRNMIAQFYQNNEQFKGFVDQVITLLTTLQTNASAERRGFYGDR
eukprot:UN30455